MSTAVASALALTGNAAMANGRVAAYFTLAQPNWTIDTDVMSQNGVYDLYFELNGNLVLMNGSGKITWASGTTGVAYGLDWSQSGYIKLLDANGGTVCTIGALNPAPGGHADVQDDGNFVFYNTSGQPTWASGTYNGRTGNLNYCYS